MNEMIFDTCVFDACEHIEKAIEQLHEAAQYCEYEQDKEQTKNLIYQLQLIYDKLV